MAVQFKKIQQNDQVQVIAGKEKGKSGRVLKVDRKNGRVYIQELNMVKKATKPKKQNDRGGIIEIEAPIDISNIMVMCDRCGPTRVGYKMKDDNKVRVCKKCGEEL
jgi:large subunit ribosomal protein L24